MVWTAKRGGMSRPLIGAVGVPLALSDDVDELAHPAAIAKFDHAGDLREQRVVLAQTDVLARLDRVPRWRTMMEPPVTNSPARRP